MLERRALVFAMLTMGLALAPAVSRAQTVPTRVAVIVDSGITVAPLVNPFRAALTALLDGLPPEMEVVLISTGGQLRVRVPPTLDRERLGKAMAGFSSDSGANSLVSTLLETDQRFLKSLPPSKGIVVVLSTDGDIQRDAGLDKYNDWMNGFLQRRGRAYAVVLRGNVMGLPSQVMENLAHNTGGTSVTIAVATGLAEQMRQVAQKIAATR